MCEEIGNSMKAVPITCGEDRWWHEYLYGSLNLCLKCRREAKATRIVWRDGKPIEEAV